jgi:hypothetical protein
MHKEFYQDAIDAKQRPSKQFLIIFSPSTSRHHPGERSEPIVMVRRTIKATQ